VNSDKIVSSNKFLELLKGITGSADFILDIGCNKGSLPENYFHRRSSIIGLDKNADFVKSNKSVRYKAAGDINYLPFKKGKFDLVIIKYVLEHIETPEISIKNLQHLLKSNQFVYAVVPKYYAFQDMFYRFLGWLAEKTGTGKQAHIQKFTFGSFCRLFYDNGFVLVEFYEASAGLSFLDKNRFRRQLKKIVMTSLKFFYTITGKDLLEKNEMHFIFCKFD